MSKNRGILQEDDAVGCRAKAGNAVVECEQTLKWFWIENIERESQAKKIAKSIEAFGFSR